MLCDGLQRKIEYLRLSVTDRCNLRCQYCMPPAGIQGRPREEILRFEEIIRLVTIMAGLGLKVVRLTGGEPLLRPQLPELVAALRRIPGLEEITLTTNGILLKKFAQALKEAGLTRINIHLDTLDADRFRHITRWGRIDEVFSGIEAARTAGFPPLKLNCVLLKGFNDGEVEDLLRFAAREDLVIRFIELMPIGPGKEMGDRYLPMGKVVEGLSQIFTLLPYGGRLGKGPANYFKIVELGSVVGFIHPVSEPFCQKCNRIRLGADGRIQDCLAYEDSVDFRKLLRDPSLSDAAISETLQRTLLHKRPDHGGFHLPACSATPGMYGIGG